MSRLRHVILEVLLECQSDSEGCRPSSIYEKGARAVHHAVRARCRRFPRARCERLCTFSNF